jgi:hypothetical protein
MNPSLLDWLGYLASAIVLISLLMSSILKLRWINLVGAILFGVYGFLIGSLPTGFMNVGIALIDVYYLVKMYRSKDYFTVLEVDNDRYLDAFIDFYRDDISLQINPQSIHKETFDEQFYVLRNMEIAGLFMGKKLGDQTLQINLDFAIPRYRDFKLGNFLFQSHRDLFTKQGYRKFVTKAKDETHVRYLKKMGFVRSGEWFVKEL